MEILFILDTVKNKCELDNLEEEGRSFNYFVVERGTRCQGSARGVPTRVEWWGTFVDSPSIGPRQGDQHQRGVNGMGHQALIYSLRLPLSPPCKDQKGHL